VNNTIISVKQEVVEEICALHERIAVHVRATLQDAIRIGQLLTEQKEALPHGEFTRWIVGNLPFTDRTARNYMHLYGERGRLETETVSALSEAYRLLKESSEPESEALLELREATAALDKTTAEVCERLDRLPPRESIAHMESFPELVAIQREALACQNRMSAGRIVAHCALGKCLNEFEEKHGEPFLRALKRTQLIGQAEGDTLEVIASGLAYNEPNRGGWNEPAVHHPPVFLWAVLPLRGTYGRVAWRGRPGRRRSLCVLLCTVLPGVRASVTGKRVQVEGAGMKAAGQRAERGAEREANTRRSGASGGERGCGQEKAAKEPAPWPDRGRLVHEGGPHRAR